MKLTSYLSEHYREEFTVNKAARLVNISAGYLSFLFKKQTGKTLIEYLNDVRVSRAAEYLVNSGMSVAEIAEEVGYENINYFGRLFKEITGLCPKQYRRLHRESFTGSA